MRFPEFNPTVPVFIRHAAERSGDRTLIALGDDRLSYAEADRRSAQLAQGLLRQGVAKGTRVAVMMPNGPDWVVAWLATTRIGAVLVPLNTFFQTQELAWILRHADVDTLLTVPRLLGHDYLSRLESAIPGLALATEPPFFLASQPYLRRVLVFGGCDRAWGLSGTEVTRIGGGDVIDDAFLAAVEASVTPADAMLILYSSGSTADPKGAVHSHGSVIRHSHHLASQRDITPDDVVWSPMPFFWVGGFIFSFLGGMHAGATMVAEEAFEPEQTLRFLERERVTIAVGWPHFGKALADHPSRPERDLSALRAGNLPDVLPEEAVSKDPELRPNGLGMTETCGPHTWWPEGMPTESLRASLGVAVDGVEHKVVDPETGETLPASEVGEICIRGYSLMQGLYKVEREDTFDRDGYYHSGDGGHFTPEGVLYFQGRLGDMIKSGGANVTPSEVEAVLAQFPEVKAAYVVGVPDAERGQCVVASVLLEPGTSADSAELRTRLKAQISAYKVPRHLFIDEDGVLPFTDSGKIDKRMLSELLAKRITD